MTTYEQLFEKTNALLCQSKTWIILLCGLVLPFALLALFDHPSADDFCYAQSARTYGLWNVQSHWYQVWSGRYAANFFLTCNPLLVDSIMGYKLLSLFLILTGSVLSMLFVKVIMNKPHIDVSVLAISFFVVFFYLLKMPSLVEGFYWLAGAITYQLANIGFLSILLILFTVEQTKNKFISIGFAFVLCIVVCGLNETSLIELVYVLVALAVYAYYNQQKIPTYYFLLIAVSVVASLVSILSPGNAVREAYFVQNKQFFNSMIGSVSSACALLIQWLPDLFLLTVLFLFFFFQTNRPKLLAKKVSLVLIIIYPVFLAGILFVGFFPAFWSMGAPPPARALNVIYLVFLVSYLYYILLLVTYAKEKNRLIVTIPLYIKFLFLFLLFTHVYAKNNIRTACMDLVSGRACVYNKEMNARYAQLKDAKNRDVQIAPLSTKPVSIFFSDIQTTSISDWRNVCTSDYFRVKSLILKEK